MVRPIPPRRQALADITQPLGQLQHRQPPMRQLLTRIFGRNFAYRLRPLLSLPARSLDQPRPQDKEAKRTRHGRASWYRRWPGASITSMNLNQGAGVSTPASLVARRAPRYRAPDRPSGALDWLSEWPIRNSSRSRRGRRYLERMERAEPVRPSSPTGSKALKAIFSPSKPIWRVPLRRDAFWSGPGRGRPVRRESLRGQGSQGEPIRRGLIPRGLIGGQPFPSESIEGEADASGDLSRDGQGNGSFGGLPVRREANRGGASLGKALWG